MKIATREQQAALEALGLRLVEVIEGFVDEVAPRAVGEEARSQAVGHTLILAVFAAANNVEWLNRVYAIDGFGVGLGVALGQWPAQEAALIGRLSDGIIEGQELFAEAMRPRGTA